ncbi:MAG: hypothetical protein NTX22_18405 [Ignavibacteriales bacterium]|nr:hypothetical protein [Ignavibacteriales bacterium]
MKFLNKLSFLLLVVTLLTLSGCYDKNYSVKTKVYPDGSFERMFIIEKDDSASVYENPFPIAFDSSWKMELKKNNDSIKTYTFTAKKHFSSPEVFRKEIVQTNELNKLNLSFKLEKQFRWFYTYLNYQEIYNGNNLWNYIPLEKFFSQKEIKQLYADSISESLKKKTEEWQQRNIFEEYFQALVKGAEELNDPSFNVTMLNLKKEQLFKALIEADANGEIILATFEKILGTKAVWKLKSKFDELKNSLQNKFELIMSLDGNYSNEIILPGIILSTNAKSVEGNKLTWQFPTDKSFLLHREMHAQSRVINTWAFVVTGALIILILAGLAIPIIRRKKLV